MQKITSLLLLLTAVLIYIGCSEEIEELNLEEGYTYMPMEKGFWVTYQVDSIVYSSFLSGGKDTLTRQVQEVLGDTFIDNEGRTAMTIERYVRTNDTIPWSAITPIIWYQVIDSVQEQGERMEGALRFINLVFPMLPDRKWQGNAYLNTQNELGVFGGWQFKYTAVNEPATINNLDFAETTTILQNDYEDKVQKLYSQEVYAKGIGLISKEQWILNLASNSIEDPADWPERAGSGYIIIAKILDYKQ